MSATASGGQRLPGGLVAGLDDDTADSAHGCHGGLGKDLQEVRAMALARLLARRLAHPMPELVLDFFPVQLVPGVKDPPFLIPPLEFDIGQDVAL